MNLLLFTYLNQKDQKEDQFFGFLEGKLVKGICVQTKLLEKLLGAFSGLDFALKFEVEVVFEGLG